MIENANNSKNPNAGSYFDTKKYVGVASINVLSINPNNEKLRKYGWQIPESAEEPEYIKSDKNGNPFTRVCFLVQIQDLEDKPVVAMNFMCRNEKALSKDGTKCKIIDAYGRTAWATKEEIANKRIPQYKNGPANISTPYHICHVGEEELIGFLMKYLNITPLQVFDSTKKEYVMSKNPGRLTIDNWNAICTGNMRELAEYVAMMPDNRVKVIFGVQTTPENRTYQTFLNTGYIGNGAMPDVSTMEYGRARKLIDKYFEGRENNTTTFSAAPVKEWVETATDVQESTSDLPDFDSLDPQPDDLPFV